MSSKLVAIHIELLADLHISFANNNSDLRDDDMTQLLRQLYPMIYDKDTVLNILFNSIDINVDS